MCRNLLGFPSELLVLRKCYDPSYNLGLGTYIIRTNIIRDDRKYFKNANTLVTFGCFSYSH
jgi:hypothetical protein